MRYRTVLLDVGETLLGPSESFGTTYARVLGPLGIDGSPREFEDAIRASWEQLDREIPPGTDRYAHFPGGERGYWLRFAHGAVERVAGRTVSEAFTSRVLDELREQFRRTDAWQVYDDVVPALTALREHGVRLGVVSNWDSRLPRVLERLGLTGYFDAVVVSSIEGVEKPDPRIFRRALAALRARPETAIHVGDVPEIDMAGARAAGIRAALVDRRGRLDPSLDAWPDLSPLPSVVLEG